MVNGLRGEIEAELDGKRYCLCLTLGALAELEQCLGEDHILAIVERFQKGEIRADDAIKVIAAGLRGNGVDVSNSEVAAMKVEGGVAGYVDIISRLLNAGFSPLK